MTNGRDAGIPKNSSNRGKNSKSSSIAEADIFDVFTASILSLPSLLKYGALPSLVIIEVVIFYLSDCALIL
jgi:hypothetical protein